MEGNIWSASPYWSSFWGQFVIELIGGTLSALVFLFLVLFLFKPKIKIAGFLCKVQNPGNAYYSFKFINLSFFSAYEVSAELYKVRKIPMGGGVFNTHLSSLTLVNSKAAYLPPYAFKWHRRQDYPHCIQIRSTEDLNTILSDEFTAIVLKISLKHGLTGLSKVFEQEYGHDADIKMGKFKPGNEFGYI